MALICSQTRRTNQQVLRGLVVAWLSILFLSSCSISSSPTGDFILSGGYDLMRRDAGDSIPARVDVQLCPSADCAGLLSSEILSADNVSCAFYSLSNKEVMSALEVRGAKLVVDGKLKERPLPADDAAFGPPQHVMHDKFCVLDGSRVVTGSYNPSTRRHQDLVIRIDSPMIARAYAAEWSEMRDGAFGGGDSPFPASVKTANGSVSVYFCPDDPCEEVVVDHINDAKGSILFEAYSFTSRAVADALIEAARRGIGVHGLVDKSQEGEFSKVARLKGAGIDVSEYRGAGLMHRKLFVIDGGKIIAGSANPTHSGYRSNDENLVVIADPGLATAIHDQMLADLAENVRLKGISSKSSREDIVDDRG